MGKPKKDVEAEMMSVLNLEFMVSMASRMLSSDYKEALEVAVVESAKILKCGRSCVIMHNIYGKLVLKAGFPKNRKGEKKHHGIGEEITKENGGDFLRQIMRGRSVMMINDTKDNPELKFMERIIKEFDISSMIILPLFDEFETLGVMVFDFMGDSDGLINLSNLNMIARLVSSEISGSHKVAKLTEEIVQKERLCVLGENYDRIAHTIRNNLDGNILGRLNRLLKHLPSDDIDGNIAKARGCASQAIKETERLLNIMESVLRYARFTSKKIKPQKRCLRNFLKEFMASKQEGLQGRDNCNVTLEYSHIASKSKKTKAPKFGTIVCLDEKSLSLSLNDLIDNAIEAGADKVVIKTVIKKKQIQIIIADNGAAIDQDVADDIFDPFMTTKKGSGLGLAYVRAVAEAHGGGAEVKKRPDGESKEAKIPRVKFILCLPSCL